MCSLIMHNASQARLHTVKHRFAAALELHPLASRVAAQASRHSLTDQQREMSTGTSWTMGYWHLMPRQTYAQR